MLDYVSVEIKTTPIVYERDTMKDMSTNDNCHYTICFLYLCSSIKVSGTYIKLLVKRSKYLPFRDYMMSLGFWSSRQSHSENQK